jgi:hypothetical protein
MDSHYDLMFGAEKPAMNNREAELEHRFERLAGILVDPNKSPDNRLEELFDFLANFPAYPLTDKQLSTVVYIGECLSAAALDEISRRDD